MNSNWKLILLPVSDFSFLEINSALNGDGVFFGSYLLQEHGIFPTMHLMYGENFFPVCKKVS